MYPSKPPSPDPIPPVSFSISHCQFDVRCHSAPAHAVFHRRFSVAAILQLERNYLHGLLHGFLHGLLYGLLHDLRGARSACPVLGGLHSPLLGSSFERPCLAASPYARISCAWAFQRSRKDFAAFRRTSGKGG